MILVFSWISTSLINIVSQKNYFEKEVNGVTEKISEIEKEVGYLSKFLAYFGTSDFLEKEARTKLNYKIQEETVVFVYKDPNTRNASASVEFEKKTKKTANYRKWFLYLLGY